MKSIKNNIYILKLIWSASPRRIIWQLLSILTESGIGMIYTLFFMRLMIECLEKGVEYARIAVYIGIYFAAIVLSRCIQAYCINVIIPETNVVIQSKLMDLIYQQALKVDLSCYENPEFYDTYTRANEEVITRTTDILETLCWIISLILSVVGYGIAVLVYEPLILPFLLIALIVVQLVQKRFVDARYKIRNETVAQRRKMDYVKRVVYQQEYAKELRLTHIFFPILRNFHKAASDTREVTRFYGKRSGIYRIISSIVSSLTVFLGVQAMIIYRYLMHNAYSFGVLTTVLNAAGGLNDCLGGIVWASAHFHEHGVFIENFRKFLAYQPRMPEKENGVLPTGGRHDLELKNVSFTYEGAKKSVLNNISISIPAGKTIALVGHNGAGKSTLVKLLMRLYDVTEGEILLDDINVKEYDAKSYRNLFGTIFQDYKIFSASIAENVLLEPICGEEYMKRAREALRASGIYDKIENLPNGMESILTKEFDEDGVIMSGGEFQKLAIARVFAKDSSIAILDEPSSALDPISEYEVFENMMKACEGKTVIFVSHRLSSATLADVIYMLEEGRIIESGNHDTLMKQNGRYAEMFTKQAQRYIEEGTV